METILKTINVTQKHIDDARNLITYITDSKRYCPIALAVEEQVLDNPYTLKGVHKLYGYAKFRVDYQKGHDRNVDVAEDIRFGCTALQSLWGSFHPPISMKHSKVTKNFVINFDKNNPVEPFSFTIQITSKGAKIIE